MTVGHEVDLIQADAVLNEFEVVQSTPPGEDALPHAQSGFHVGDALVNAANGVPLVGADPLVIASRQAFKQASRLYARWPSSRR